LGVYRIELKDYRAAVWQNPQNYPDPDQEIRWASIGTDIALRFLDDHNLQSRLWSVSFQLVRDLLNLLREKIEKEGVIPPEPPAHFDEKILRPLRRIFHYTCNSLGKWGGEESDILIALVYYRI